MASVRRLDVVSPPWQAPVHAHSQDAGRPGHKLSALDLFRLIDLKGPVGHRELVIPKRVLSGRGLFDDTGKIVGLTVVPADLLVRLAVRVGQAAVGQLRYGAVARGQPSGPCG